LEKRVVKRNLETVLVMSSNGGVHLTHPEVLLTGDSTGQMFNLCAWDTNSGAALTTFKGAASARNTLAMLSDSMVVSAQPSKPLLNVWYVNR
jgi:hypothetical protein